MRVCVYADLQRSTLPLSVGVAWLADPQPSSARVRHTIRIGDLQEEEAGAEEEPCRKIMREERMKS